MIELHLILKVSPKHTRSITEALQALAKNARSKEGCVDVEVHKVVGARNCLCYDEIWESESCIREMIASRHFSQLAALMELSKEPPACEFRFINKIQGLEFAEEVRRFTPSRNSVDYP